MGLSNTVYDDTHAQNTAWKSEIEDRLDVS